jgi:hypothetical protein
MTRSSHLAALFLLSAGSLMFLSACNKKAEAPEGTPTLAPAATATSQPAIIVTSPQSGDQATVPIKVTGSASVFEAAVTIAVESADGNRTFCRTTTTASEGAPGTGSFETQIAFPPPTEPTDGRVQVYSISPKDGSIQNLVSVPVVISSDQPAIVVDSPLCDAQVTSPVTITGTASVFEAALTVVVSDADGNELASANIMASAGAPERGDFSTELSFSLPGGAQMGRIEAYSRSAEDGSIINLFSVPVLLVP